MNGPRFRSSGRFPLCSRDQSIVPNSFHIGAAVNDQQWQLALAIFETMRSTELKTDVVAWNSAITACEKGAAWLIATRLISSMVLPRAPRPNTISVSAAVSACEKGYQWLHALRLLSWSERVRADPNTITFNATITACGNVGKWQHALSVLALLESHALAPDVITFNACMSACAQGWQWQISLGLMRNMSDLMLEPNVITLSAAIFACEKGERWEDALAILYSVESRRVCPSIVLSNAALSACARVSKWDVVLFLFSDLQRLLPVRATTKTFNIVASALRRGNQWQSVLALLSRVKQKPSSKFPRPDTELFHSTIATCISARQLHRSSEIFQEMHARGIRPDIDICGILLSEYELEASTYAEVSSLQKLGDADGLLDPCRRTLRVASSMVAATLHLVDGDVLAGARLVVADASDQSRHAALRFLSLSTAG